MSAEPIPLLSAPHGLPLRGRLWGVDVSTQRIALGMLDLSGDGVLVEADSCALAQSEHEGARLARAGERLRDFFEEYRDHPELGRPRMVVVEMPFATVHRVRPTSYFMVAVVLQSLWEVLGLSCEIETLNPTEWKAKALGQGRGFARKHEILAWARSIGFTGTCASCSDGLAPTKEVGKGRRAGLDCRSPSHGHDEADALGCATAGAVMLAARV